MKIVGNGMVQKLETDMAVCILEINTSMHTEYHGSLPTAQFLKVWMFYIVATIQSVLTRVTYI